MYKKEMWIFDGSIEVEIKHLGRYGAKGEKRMRKQKPTPEQIKKQNQLNKEKRMRRMIKANFRVNDMWVTLKYPAGERPPIEKVVKDLKRFFRKLRAAYQKRGAPMKYIYRLELGKMGGIHIHMILNRIEGADILIQRFWESGRAFYESMYDSGGFEALAAYIVKIPPEEIKGQLTLFEPWERKALVKYSASRNLIRPTPKTRTLSHRTVERMIRNGVSPKKGFYVDKSSVRCGINPYTGFLYIYYTEHPLKRGGDDG